jgi:diguanylate cyclase (GGDEF)-like protein
MRILIAEDDLTSRAMLGGLLKKWGYEVIAVSNGQQAWDELVKPDAPGIAIIDWEMPELTGIEVIERFRKREASNYAYMILLTARDDKGNIIEGISKGADDYVIKPFDPEELSVRIRAGQRIVDLEAQLLETNRQLEEIARTDPLTGLANRRALIQELQSRFQREMDYSMPTAFIMADIDYFKQINDNYGHDAGDEVLKCVAERLKEAFRFGDIVSRFGGDEFLVILPEANPKLVSTISERARRMIEEKVFEISDGVSLPITCSFGVSFSNLKDKTSVDKYIKQADQALYESKRGGRNKVTIFAVNCTE